MRRGQKVQHACFIRSDYNTHLVSSPYLPISHLHTVGDGRKKSRNSPAFVLTIAAAISHNFPSATNDTSSMDFWKCHLADRSWLLWNLFTKWWGAGAKEQYNSTREIPGVALVNILIRWIFMGKGNTHLKWNIEEVAHVEEKIFEWDTIFCEIAF